MAGGLAAEHVGKDGMVSAMALAAREATPDFVYQPWGLVWEITSFPHS